MKKKLIEVALPLVAINSESAREKSIRHGHPSTLHLWWARRPLAATRAVIWASLVDDPSAWPNRFPTEIEQNQERQRLLNLLARIDAEDKKQKVQGLVCWEEINKPNSPILQQAQAEIARSIAWNRSEEPPIDSQGIRDYIEQYAPPLYDPFCGGGSIPLEAQRLGLVAIGSDLNPVAVLITKALIEIPPQFAHQPPINPDKPLTGKWYGAQGLAADVAYYGEWMFKEAKKRIGHLYPTIGEATVIAWLWARTVKCPNPACGCKMPLVSSFALSTKKGKEVWVEPIIDKTEITYQVKSGIGKIRPETVNRKGAICVACETPVPLDYIRSEGKAGRMDAQLIAIVAEGKQGRSYLSPDTKHIEISKSAQPEWYPEAELPHNTRDFKTPNYGMRTHADLFTPRQLVALTTFSDLVTEAREEIKQVASETIADAVATYLAFAVDKLADYHSTICTWHVGRDTIRNTFARQAIPMTWDYAEANPLSDSTGNFCGAIAWIVKVIKQTPSQPPATTLQKDAITLYPENPLIISTDPPYYDNIGYADLSDFFYVWLRRSLQNIYPQLFNTLLVPKTSELVATPHRFEGSKQKAQTFFETGLSQAFQQMYHLAHPDYPLTIYYAFKQTEKDSKTDSVASTGWETMLTALIQAGFSINGTWPMRTELSNRSVGINTNALASSIVLVCRPRPKNAPKASKRQFNQELKRDLFRAIKLMQSGNIAPVDLAQASIGPGIGIFSQYSAVVEADETPVTIRTALEQINQTLDEFLSEQEGEFDNDTRWALIWFEQHQFQPASYGEAETLSRAKNTSVEGLVEAGIIEAKAGKVHLLSRQELPNEWKPETDKRIPIWKMTQHLARVLETQGESGAGRLLARIGPKGELGKDLAYRLYNLCEQQKWNEESFTYNSLVISWPEISRLSYQCQSLPTQLELE